MDLDFVTWTAALPLGSSAQKAELKALTEALKLEKGAIAIFILPTDGIFDAKETLPFLKTSLPLTVTIIHCPGNQRGTPKISLENMIADKSQKRGHPTSTTNFLVALLSAIPEYTANDK